MTLARRDDPGFWLDPWRDLDRRINQIFGGSQLAPSNWTPSVDVAETDTAYRIHASLPDVRKEDIHVSFEDGVLSIRGERKTRKEEKNERWHRTEIASGSFFRSFTMPADADAEKLAATYDNGVLDVTIPKTAPKAAGSRRVEVK